MPHKDPEVRREYHRQYMASRFANDPEHRRKHLKRVLQNKLRRKEEARVLVASFRQNGCTVCGEREPCCLVAHHRNPRKKEFSVSQMVSDGFRLEKIAAELEKCVCLCENCHRKIHAGVLDAGNANRGGGPHKPASLRGRTSLPRNTVGR